MSSACVYDVATPPPVAITFPSFVVIETRYTASSSLEHTLRYCASLNVSFKEVTCSCARTKQPLVDRTAPRSQTRPIRCTPIWAPPSPAALGTTGTCLPPPPRAGSGIPVSGSTRRPGGSSICLSAQLQLKRQGIHELLQHAILACLSALCKVVEAALPSDGEGRSNLRRVRIYAVEQLTGHNVPPDLHPPMPFAPQPTPRRTVFAGAGGLGVRECRGSSRGGRVGLALAALVVTGRALSSESLFPSSSLLLKDRLGESNCELANVVCR